MDEACCTCATLLQNCLPQYDEKSEKPKALDRRLDCCRRVICGSCIASNPRFATYCIAPLHNPENFNSLQNLGPFCQVSTKPSPLPQGLRDPPSYTPTPRSSSFRASPLPPGYDDLPTYSSSLTDQQAPPPEKSQPSEDVLHFLDHSSDTLIGLSFRYNVPISSLRKANNLTSDHLLLARRTLVIPGEFYKGGVSLSPRPVEGEEEERRKWIVRRWMIACKVSEYVFLPCLEL
jgi:hypothetical protein